MKIAVDLHIHSALSPCSENDMTPNNIVNMAIIKDLDAIAITDHNSCDNIEAAIKVAGDRIIVLPGMEVQTSEEIHVLCYFKDVKTIKLFDRIIKEKLPNIKNNPKLFGDQLIMDQYDNIVGKRESLLLNSINLSIEEIVDVVRELDGAVVPAHINRPSYSIISQLGFIPQNLGLSVLEISHSDASFTHDLQEYMQITSSDAHDLVSILEREMFIHVENKSVNSLLNVLKIGHL